MLSYLWVLQEIFVINRGNNQGVNKDNYYKISLRRDLCLDKIIKMIMKFFF